MYIYPRTDCELWHFLFIDGALRERICRDLAASRSSPTRKQYCSWRRKQLHEQCEWIKHFRTTAACCRRNGRYQRLSGKTHSDFIILYLFLFSIKLIIRMYYIILFVIFLTNKIICCFVIIINHFSTIAVYRRHGVRQLLLHKLLLRIKLLKFLTCYGNIQFFRSIIYICICISLNVFSSISIGKYVV